MQTIIAVIHLFLAIGLIGLILIQHGKGADAGAAFGSGASATVFGAQGSASFLTRATAILAVLFFVTSMVMAYFAAQSRETTGIMESMSPAAEVRVQDGDVPMAPAASDVPVVPVDERDADVPVVPAAEPEVDVPAIESEAKDEAPQVQTKE